MPIGSWACDGHWVPERWELECGGEETGQGVEGGQVHSQDLGVGLRKGPEGACFSQGPGQLGLSGLHTTQSATCATGQGYTGTRGPSVVAGRVRGAVGSSPTRRQESNHAGAQTETESLRWG